MLLFGTFGSDAPPASQRADRLSRGAILVFVAISAALAFAPGIGADVRARFHVVALGMLFAFLGWQRWSYANGLDELARQLYIEALAITYLIGLTLFAFFGLLHSLVGWLVDPLVFMVLEPVRAVILVWRTRQFAA
jgi:hypothetical protein